ncbi:MAG: winged helix-turn-helix domain-containing protein [Desulfurococcaceae archaeon]|nr:winged helix-turn-helix domain-containing protein [Desulfurococcaceae archaeon]
MRKLVIIPYTRRFREAIESIGVDEESLAIVFLYGRSSGVDTGIDIDVDTVFVESSDIVKAVSTAISYATNFEKVRVVVAETLDPYTATATVFSFIALATLEPFNKFSLEPLALYYRGRLREFYGKPRLWIRSLRDLDIVKALRFGCSTSNDIANKTSIPVESVRRRISELSRAGLVDCYRNGRRYTYCLNDTGRMFTT